MVAPWRKPLSAMTTTVSRKNSLAKSVLISTPLDRTTLYTANRDISYYTVHESFVATIPLVFCEAEKMDPNTQFLKVMMIDEPAILDQGYRAYSAGSEREIYRAEKCAVLPRNPR